MGRKQIYKLVSVLVFLFSGISVALAQPTGQIQAPVNKNIFEVISSLSTYIRPLILVVFLGVIIYAGITIQTSAGDPEKQKKGWDTLKAGIVGFIIIALAPVIVEIVGRLIGVRGDFF
ncbi:hypothetical protein JW978_04590 [Candidatus Dojkabacteria bacterium]|nr:hypothetical protein [Candidatus Dojkabacteria bacterium]